jgi:hypothetical protein
VWEGGGRGGHAPTAHAPLLPALAPLLWRGCSGSARLLRLCTRHASEPATRAACHRCASLPHSRVPPPPHTHPHPPLPSIPPAPLPLGPLAVFVPVGQGTLQGEWSFARQAAKYAAWADSEARRQAGQSSSCWGARGREAVAAAAPACCSPDAGQGRFATGVCASQPQRNPSIPASAVAPPPPPTPFLQTARTTPPFLPTTIPLPSHTPSAPPHNPLPI